jgi:hypothetical protein
MNNIILIGITILGWFAAYYFNRKVQISDVKNNLKLKIYENLSVHFIELMDKSVEMNILISSDINEKIFSHHPNDYQNDFLTKLREKTEKLQKVYFKLFQKYSVWESLTPTIDNSLEEKFKVYQAKIFEFADLILNINSQPDSDLAIIKKDELVIETRSLFFDTEQFIALIHNELATPLLGVKKNIHLESHRNDFISNQPDQKKYFN